MAKKSNRGKGYFHAKGKRDKLKGGGYMSYKMASMRFSLPPWGV